MKKMMLLLAALVLVGSVFAIPEGADVRVTSSVDAGSVGVDSPLYGLDVFFDELSVSGTADEQALKRLKIAKERLAELEDAQDKSFDVEHVRQEHVKQLDKIKELKVKGLSDDVNEEVDNHLLVLQRVRDKLDAKGNLKAVSAIDAILARDLNQTKRGTKK